ncbi:MAG: hypothetical protein A2521_15120 [Deltaproteobacteria bacterium RIFOXYD12_FULL_57_12]|nr:MAG: hypothetical protein A2521_15120 [Deltaproteobacteria bacterium RIFOXYD12_FULL_57_12]
MHPTYASELRDILLRQAEYLKGLDDSRALMALPSFVDLVCTEPTLSAISKDLLYEGEQQTSNFVVEHDAWGVNSLKSLWSEHSNWLLELWRDAEKDEETAPSIGIYGKPTDFDDFLAKRGHESPPFREATEDKSVTGAAIKKIEAWADLANGNAKKSQLDDLRKRLNHISQQHDKAFRQYLLNEAAHAGVALTRLRKIAAGLLPAYYNWNPEKNVHEQNMDVLLWLKDSQISNALFSPTKFQPTPAEYAGQMRRDIDLVVVEILRRVGLHLSYRALILRLKTRCERFDGDSLRERMERLSKMKPGARKEDLLTEHCARYLFDQGLNPLFNASIVRLRPDLFDSSSAPEALYVEAKQYSETNGLRKKLQKATWQVWSTWSELEGSNRVSEGYLLVFRVGGPLVQFDDRVRFQNKTLYPILVDIAPPNMRGSREKSQPIHIAAAEMIPSTNT